jgi:hypothetical protein
LTKMTTTYHWAIARFIFIVGLICALAWLGWSPLAQAGPELPPRGTPTPIPPPGGSDEKDNKREKPPGAYIELQTQPSRAGLWAVVQWQDNAGGWRDVEGWRGALDTSGYQRWWVAAKDFDTGPFRWLVTAEPGGRVLGGSAPFNLPRTANETTRVQVKLEQ